MRWAFDCCLLTVCAIVLAGVPPALAAAEVGQPAPALVVKELNGKTFDLAAQRGKVAIVNFWATWCAPCRGEMPALDAFYRRYHSRGLDMIGLSVDRSHDRSEVAKVMKSFSYPAAMVNEASANGFGEPDAVPETFVIDSKGVVRAKLTPGQTPITAQTLSAAVLPLLAKNESRSAPSGKPQLQSSEADKQPAPAP